MKFLFVVDQLPYPPRNGVTIPTFNWISRLSLEHRVSLLYVKDDMIEISREQFDENMCYVKNLWVLERSRASTYIRIKDELIGRKPFFLGWSCDLSKLSRCLNGSSFDVVWGSPLSVAEIMDSIGNLLGSKTIYVAGINDCNTAVLRSMGREALTKVFNFKTRVLYSVNWLRSWLIEHLEPRILNKYDLILVQTDIERRWLAKISAKRLSHKIMIAPNGVNESLFNLPIGCESKNLLFFASLGGGYGKVLVWILKKVWPLVRKVNKGIRFSVVGRGACDELKRRMSMDDRIDYTEYIPDICDVYKDKAILLAPVFKGYGLINKVVESMAAGVPVVGDSGSFNGIPEFKNGYHGLVANDPKGMANAILNILNSSRMQISIAYSARELIKKYFSWNDRIEHILEKLEFIRNNKCELAKNKNETR
jgi:glycosyltransferase involved in cell wall biosynthesis